MSRPIAVSHDEAEVLALNALGFLAGEPARLMRFLDLTGLTPHDLRTRADTIEVQTAVLGHLMGAESELLVFVAEQRVEPESVAQAFHRLSPPIHD